MTTNQKINKLLNDKRIPKYEFDDLRVVIEACEGVSGKRLSQIFAWFRFLQDREIIGWRPKPMTKTIVNLLKKNSPRKPLILYALFCPSYKKGKQAFGFRTDDVGNTTITGIKNLDDFYQKTQLLGFSAQRPIAIFFDLAIEQYSKVISAGILNEIDENIENFKKRLPAHFDFIKLSDFSFLKSKIGYSGIRLEVLLIPQRTLERIIERGMKFYRLFGWTKKQVYERSLTIACSEALVGKFLRKKLPNSIMVYTPTMLERGAVFSGMEFDINPLPIIFPKKLGP